MNLERFVEKKIINFLLTVISFRRGIELQRKNSFCVTHGYKRQSNTCVVFEMIRKRDKKKKNHENPEKHYIPTVLP